MRKTGVLAWPFLLLSGCGTEPTPRVTVTDDAGVRVTITLDTSAVYAELDSIPRLSIGGPDASGPTEFFRIQNLYVDQAERIWVADGQSNELRIFNGDGSHWKTRGGRGEGPGEFLQIRLLGAGHGDSVWMGDSRSDRVTVFDPDGEFVRTQRLPSMGRPAPRPFDVFPDGTILGQQRRIVAAASLSQGQILPDSVELVRVDLDSVSVAPNGAASGPLWLWTGRNQIPVPFTTNASFDVVDGAVHVVSGPEFQVSVHGAGRLNETYGVQREARAAGSAEADGYRAFVEEYIPADAQRDYLAALEHELRPSLLPGYNRVLAGADGFVWAQVYEVDRLSAHTWDVFDDQRRFRGRVYVPGDFYPFVILADAVAGVWRDSVGVEHVRVYGYTGG